MEDDTKRKLNILIAHNYYQIPGGEDSVVQNESKLLEDKSHNVFLYKRSNNEIKDMNAIRKLLLPFITVFNVRTFFDIRKIIKEKKIDIVHVHNTLFFISPSIYFAAKSLRIPVIQTIHNFRLLCVGATFYKAGSICEECIKAGPFHAMKYKCYRNSFLQTFLCALNNSIHIALKTYKNINFICLTEFNKEKLLNLKHINPDKIYIKPNFIKADLLIQQENTKRTHYVFVGRIDELKGIKVLLQAWKLLQQKEVFPELYICGSGPLFSWCEEYLQKNNITNIKLLGFIDNAKARELISTAKGLILPTQWYEGFPVSIVEALSVGTPVIGSNMGNVGDIIIDGITGKRIDGKDPQSLCSAIESLENEYTFNHKEISNICRATYGEVHNYDILIAIYNDVMEKNK